MTCEQKLLAEDTLADVPVVVMGNKIDMRDAVSEDELRIAMGLTHTSGKQVRCAPHTSRCQCDKAFITRGCCGSLTHRRRASAS